MGTVQLNDISVKAKIYAMTGFLIGALIISTGYGLFSMNKIGGELVTIAEEDIKICRLYGANLFKDRLISSRSLYRLSSSDLSNPSNIQPIL